MLDPIEFYTGVLEVNEPWYVSKVEMDKARKRVDVYLEYRSKTEGICPECGKETVLYDRREDRVWRHSDSCCYQTYLHCKIPRTNCKEHGIKTMGIPWSEPENHFTNNFEKQAIDTLQATKNRSKASGLLRLSWDEMNGIMQRAVGRGLERRKTDSVKYLGIDEKSFLSGQSYATVVTDTQGKRVLEVVENRDEEAAKKAFQCLNEGQRAKVKAVSMDFWQAYINAAESELPKAKKVHDKFHVMKYIHEAVNGVRAQEHKWRKKQKDAVLTGTKYLWLKKLENFTDKDKQKWAELKLDQLEVGKAWNLKELFNEFWNCENITSARKMFKSWYNSATHSGLEPMAKVAKTIKNHLDNIINWWWHHITNSYAEGINSVIQEIKAVARGFRNFQNYRTAILFFCGKLSLYPQGIQ